MGDTRSLLEEGAMPWKECHGGWTSGCGLSRDCWMGKRWRSSAARSTSPRKTGYKIFSRYKDCGLEGLTDRSRRPYRQANRLPFQVEKRIVQLKRRASDLGGARNPGEVAPPAYGALLAGHQHRARHPGSPRAGQSRPPAPLPRCGHAAGTGHGPERSVVRRLQRRVHAHGSPVLLSADHHRLRQPLSARLRGASTSKERYAFTVFERAFQELGCPRPSARITACPLPPRTRCTA